ncbi:MAG TPA: glycoside hydrolase family 36 protein [Planctomycetota bacterium]|nr:glycoside hydrolase family 36 protein [Planctomycetota bacterium]
MGFMDYRQLPSFSFQCDGKPSAELLARCRRTTSTEATSAGSLRHDEYVDSQTGLVVMTHLRTFDDFPALDWLMELENRGSDSPLIENILPLDASIPFKPGDRLVLHHANGSLCRMDDFLPQTTDLPPGGSKRLAPFGGRSSNGVLPFMNLQRRDAGMVIAIGWPGQWAAQFERSGEALRIFAGMERTSIRLPPGEKIRTPRILLLPWDGDDPETGNNLLRRLLMAHYMPRLNGELVTPPAAQCLQGYFYLTGKAGEQYEMAALPKAAEAGCTAYWIDACWYGGSGQWWEEVGSWVINREKFPHGLRPISDAARKAGMKFVLWFEPERVRPNSLLRREHPEFLLASPHDQGNFLYNMGMPEAREYLTELISGLIDEQGIDIYRQDFNFDPLPYWQAADAPDRIGMTEIRYVEGFLAFWDELRRRHPAMWIDNCASGGRRIDLETMSRSLPLWPSDFPDVCGLPYGLGLHVGDQCINAGLARWVPLFGGGVWNFTPYGTRSQIIGGFTFGFHIDHSDFPPDGHASAVHHNDVMRKGRTLMDADFPLEAAKAAIAEWKSVKHFFLGHFHPLAPITASPHDWCAWQFHRGDLNAGIAMFFRRHRSPFPSFEAHFREIIADAEYEVTLSADYAEGPRRRMTGSELAEMVVTIAEAPGSVLMRYRTV